MKNHLLSICFFLPSLIYAQPQKGDLLVNLRMYALSQHLILPENSPGTLASAFYFQPRIGYFFSERSMIGISPFYSTSHSQSLLQYGGWNNSKGGGGEVFLRQYSPQVHWLGGISFFGEISGRGRWSNHDDSRPRISNSHYLEGRAKIGISKQMAEGLFFELRGEYQFFRESKIDTVLRYSELFPKSPFRLRGGFQIILGKGKYLGHTMPFSRKGWKTIGGNFTYTPVSHSFFGSIKKGKYQNENLFLGINSNFGIRLNELNKSVTFGIGPLAKYVIPMSPRFGFLAAFEGRAAVTFPIRGDDKRFRKNFLNATPSIGMQFFLNPNLALELAMKRPFSWRHEIESGEISHSGKWRVMRLEWELVYFFK